MLTIQELEALRGLVQINININLPKGHHMAYDQTRLPFSWKPPSITGATVAGSIPMTPSLDPGITELTWVGAPYLTIDLSSFVSLTQVDIRVITALVGALILPASVATLIATNLAEVGELQANGVPWTSLQQVSALKRVMDGSFLVETCTSLSDATDLALERLVGDFKMSGCALTEASVDYILAMLIACTTDGATPWVGEVKLSGGTNAIPSGAGLASKATLEGRGCTVIVNS